tara:strand:- start:125 stop:751 length:627 start_codon:yes stop_codon:yes gene_type:complete
MAIGNLELEQEGLDVLGSMNRAIPGESLTANPDEPRPWEQPPEFTTMQEALDSIVSSLLEEETYLSIVGAVKEGIPISDVVQQILYIGFNQGKWNPDLLMMLLEPLMYVVMALCEKSGVEFTLYRGEEQDEDVSSETAINDRLANLESLKNITKPNILKPKASSVPAEILEDIEEAEVPSMEGQPSLMGKPETEEPGVSGSLLAQAGA